jgi:hypothetical protein
MDKVWITKYATTQGILELENSEFEVCGKNLIRVASPDGGHVYFHGDEWHATYETARDKALAMISAKKKSATRTLAKLNSLEHTLNKGQDA